MLDVALKAVSFTWRSQYGGHYDCGSTHGDYTVPYVAPTDHSDEYHYDLFKLYDSIAMEIIPEYNEEFKETSLQLNRTGSAAQTPSIDYMDMSPLYLRADAHPASNGYDKYDCLHFCLPGPLHLFSILMLHYVLETQTIENAD